jgi:hypothetical protein
MSLDSSFYGYLVEFDRPEALLRATRAAVKEGYSKLDAYTPFPIEGLAEAIGFHHTRIPFIVLISGICGGVIGFFLQYWISVIDYPVNVGGRPLNSWPSFVPVTFELTILFAAISAVFGMIALNELPKPYHPLFNVPRFELASRTHFFLCIEARDPKFDREQTKQWLEATGAEVFKVEN